MNKTVPTATKGERLLSLLRSLSGDVDSASQPDCVSPDFLMHFEEIRKECVDAPSTYKMLMVRLPAIGKWFDKLLSSGRWSEPPWEIKVPQDIHMPLFGLWNVVPFVDAICLRHGDRVRDLARAGVLDEVLTPNDVFMIRQSLFMFKKFTHPCGRVEKELAVHEFWAIDDGLREPRSTLEPDKVVTRPGRYEDYWDEGDSRVLLNLLRLMDQLSVRLAPSEDLDPVDLVPGHGPGAVSDMPLDGDKYTFPSYPQVIEDTMPHLYFLGANWRLADWREVSESKTPAKLIAVAKTLEKPRLIASEPVVHQFLQQGLMKWLRCTMHPVHKIMVDFTDQEPSREAALKASYTGRNATVDLSAASDRLSTYLVESHFGVRPILLDTLLRTRSDTIYDPILLKERRRIKKFAPMGSAVTFPVQSIIYATACLACGLLYENRYKVLKSGTLRRLARRVRVFGDDLILPVEWVPYLDLLLTKLQLKINRDKTHNSGFFRESCGMDAYRGFNVTPSYVSHSAPTQPGETLVAYVEQSNNAWRKGLWSLSKEMEEQIPAELRNLIPISSESLAVCALYTYSRGTISTRRRKSKHLHRWEVKGFTLTSRERKYKRTNQADLLQYFLEQPDPLTKWEAGVKLGRRAKPELVWVSAEAEEPGRQCRLPKD